MTSESPLGALLSCLIDYRGKTPPKSTSGIKLITAKVIKNGSIDESRLEYISEETYDTWMRRGFPRRGDILVTTEAPLGEVAQLRTDEPVALAQRVILIRADPARVDSQYLFHWLRSPLARTRLQQRSSGTTVSGIRQPELREVSVDLPPRTVQKRIGAILDAIDDLIENSRRRIALLEQMAQAFYREWFVHFRYPGHEDDELVDSPLGPIPARWEALPASVAVEINPSVTGQRGSDVPFVAMADLEPGLMHVMPSSTRRFGGGGSKFERHDTLFARITPSVENGKTGFVQFLADGEIAMGSTEFLVCRGRRLSAYSAYLLMRQDDLRRHAVGSMSGASGRQRVNNACFDTYLVAVPPPALEGRFADSVAPMFAAVEVLSQMNMRLARLRDLLLPKLVTGAIDVSKLDLDALLEAA